MSKVLHVAPLPGYPDEIGRWLWAMQITRSRTLELVEGLDQVTLDWEGPDGQDNSIGTLLYHIALVEMSWLYLDIFEEEFPPAVKNNFPFDMGRSNNRLTRVANVSLKEPLGRLVRSRSIFLDAFRQITLNDWRRIRNPADVEY
ncbi:DinB family protein, partial [Alicyclobacillus fodiniaquatilis]